MAQATISSGNQIAIPRVAREALNLKAGDRLQAVVRCEKAILLQSPKSYRKAIRGLAQGRYPGGYLKEERKSWD